MAKYDALRDYLAGLPRGQRRVTMGFAKIEQVLGAPLPPSAHVYEDWWQGSSRWSKVVTVRAWEKAGWVVDDLNLRAKLVTFRKQD
jgi:hypothetical protein